MKINQAGIDLIKRFETCKLEAYLCPAGIPTIGWGHVGLTTNMPVKFGEKITQAWADKLLSNDLNDFCKAVSEAVTVPLTENQFSALVCLCYNIGAGAFKKSTLVKKLNKGDSVGASQEFLRWNKAGGKVLKGLTTRREAEKALFLK